MLRERRHRETSPDAGHPVDCPDQHLQVAIIHAFSRRRSHLIRLLECPNVDIDVFIEIYNQDHLLLDVEARRQADTFGLILVEGFLEVASSWKRGVGTSAP